jgi:Tol biopolymer transport system component
MRNAFKSLLIVGLFMGFQSCRDNPVGPGGGLGGKIVFSMTTGATPYNSGQTHIYVINADGSGLRQLTFGPYEDMPRWSPDGSRVVFVSDSLWTSLGNPMWIMNADGSNWHLVRYFTETQFPQPGEFPSWSPDGKKITFDWCTHCEWGVMIWDIYVVDLTTDEISQLTNGDGTTDYPVGSNSAPTWSPDGNRIYFQSTRADSAGSLLIYDVYSMDSDGSGVQRITSTANGYSGVPCVSPNGEKLAFVRGDTSGNELYVVGVDGSNPVALTTPPLGNTIQSPRWSADNKQIMFASGGSIFLINVDGTGLMKMPLPNINTYYFDWTNN